MNSHAFRVATDKQSVVQGCHPIQLTSTEEAGGRTFIMDSNGAGLLKFANARNSVAEDFLLIATAVYGIDKATPRSRAADRWTRAFEVSIAVQNPETWNRQAGQLAACLEFLTGDRWFLSFELAQNGWLVPDDKQPRPPVSAAAQADAVSLFSGGLDSLIGVINWLKQNRDGRLLAASHYDHHVGGPKKDQNLLHTELPQDRVKLVQWQAGLRSAGAETSFRSRSFLFIALASLLASERQNPLPLIIPENGAIALSYPLTPSRQGACSTRTVHPHFLLGLEAVLSAVGLPVHLDNPYELKTKGEMVAGCKDKGLLKRLYGFSRSCARSGHRRNWPDGRRDAPACGACIPCIFRRAALQKNNWDSGDDYGFDVLTADFLPRPRTQTRADFDALLNFLVTAPSEAEIREVLHANGPLPVPKLSDYASVVMRLRQELLDWFQAKARPEVKQLLGNSQ